MYTTPFDHLAVVGNTATYYSEPTELGSDNAINVTCSVVNVSGGPTNVDVKYEQSNDGSNWKSATTFITIGTPVAGSQTTASASTLAARYIRLSAKLGGGTSPKILLFVEMNTSRLT